MDKKYLTSLEGSPYVNEGLWDRVKSRGAAGMQRYRGITGSGWKPIDEAKLESLWSSFKKKLIYLVKDFNDDLIPTIQSNRPNDIVTYKTDIDKFAELGKLLAPARQFSDTQLQQITTPRRYDDPTNLTKSGGNKGVNFGEMLREAGIGKFFRPLSITQARMANDTKRTIAAYKGQVKKLYTEFLEDVKTVLKLPDLTSAGKSVAANKPEWKSVLNKWEETIGVPVSDPNAPATATGTAQPAAAGIATTSAQPNTTSTSYAPSPAQAAPLTSDPNAAQPAAAPNSKLKSISDKLDITVIETVIKLIIDKIFADPRSNEDPHYYKSRSISSWRNSTTSREPAPSSDYDPSAFNAAKYAASTPPSAVTEAGDKTDMGFLYKFASNYRKHTGSFTLPLGAFTYNGLIYQVKWHSFSPGERGHGHANEILLTIFPANKTDATETIKLFFFWDHEIDPREHTSLNFNIPKLFENAHPNIGTPFDATEIQNLTKYTEHFHRALFAVTDRKTLEFKRALPDIGKKALEMLIEVYNWEDTPESEEYVRKSIQGITSSKRIPDIKTIVEDAIKLKEIHDLGSGAVTNIESAEKALIKLGVDSATARSAVQKAVQDLKNAGNTSPTEEELTTLALRNRPVAIKLPPAPVSVASTSPTNTGSPVAPTSPTPPVIHADGTIEWNGKKIRTFILPSALNKAIADSGQTAKWKAVQASMRKPKPPVTENKTTYINPYVKSNFIY